MSNARKFDRKRLVTLLLLALFTAIVVVLQLAGAFIRLGTFSVSLVLMPIVVGAALCGALSGGWLGFVFGLAVLLSGDAAAFIQINPAGTVAVVLLKGALAGLASGAVYKLTSRKNKTLAAIISAITAPIVNTGVFTIGCYLFFLPALTEWAAGAGFASATPYIFTMLIGLNFFFELGVNLVLCPVIVRLVRYGQSRG
ncbi:MAG: ECF transporter S component [Oscillospiraceae bacterium]|jgi:uncharacterized membrane protein|nr:ECF transporter S component [Oscillospiraceae bacterium]